MKLLMPKKSVTNENILAMMYVNNLRGVAQHAAARLDVELEECDPDLFSEFAFIAEGYAIALAYVRTAEDTAEAEEYLEGCCQVFRREISELTMVDRGFPDFVRKGYDKLLASIAAKMERNGVSGAFRPTLH